MGYTDINGIFRGLGDVPASLGDLQRSNPDRVQDDGKVVQLDDGRHFMFRAGSSLTADDLFVVAPANGAGRYVLAPGYSSRVPLAITSANTDAQVLATLPTGFIGRVVRGDWGTPSASWTGGSSSAIGFSSNNAAHDDKGDLHGGSSGDVAAALEDGAFRPGTVGDDVAAGVYLVGGNTIRFDRVTSAFTAGATVAGLTFEVVANPG